MVLPQGTPVGKVPVTKVPCGSTQNRKAAGKFRVPIFLVSDSDGPGGKGTNALLQLVWDAHASGVAHQAPLDGTTRPEYTDEVEEKECGDSIKLHRGDLQSNREDGAECFEGI